MEKTYLKKLAALQQQEAELSAELETVRKAIRELCFAQPVGAGDMKLERPPELDDSVSRFLNQVLDGLGVQFTSAELFETAKKMKPHCDRRSLLKAMHRLQRAGIIQKIEAGRGWHPARFEKVFKH
jgi:hypothetical protein